MSFVIACGGTGGHLFPGLAVAEVLKDRGHDVLLFVSSKEIDRLALKNHGWLRAESLPVTGMPSIFSLKLIGFIKGFFISLFKCLSIYKKEKPACILSMGGFTAAPPVIAGWIKRIPALVHDSNAIPGKANRLVSHFVTKVLLGLDACKGYFPRKPVEITGTPLRKSLTGSRQKNHGQFGLNAEKKTILVMGGSQGAGGINEIVLKTLPLLNEAQKRQWQFLHITGAQDEMKARGLYEKSGVQSFVSAFSHEMGELYILADVAISRSGAASMTELSFFGIPTLFIPYPYAAEDHQTRNARVFEKAGAALLVSQAEATPQKMIDVINELLNQHDKFSQNARGLFIENAEVKVADVMETLCR